MVPPQGCNHLHRLIFFSPFNKKLLSTSRCPAQARGQAVGRGAAQGRGAAGRRPSPLRRPLTQPTGRLQGLPSRPPAPLCSAQARRQQALAGLQVSPRPLFLLCSPSFFIFSFKLLLAAGKPA